MPHFWLVFDLILIYASNWKTLTIDYGYQWLFLNYYFWIKRWAGCLFNFANVLQKIVGFLCSSCIIIARLALSLHASMCKHIYACFFLLAYQRHAPECMSYSLYLFCFFHSFCLFPHHLVIMGHLLSCLWNSYYQIWLKVHCTILQLKILANSWECLLVKLPLVSKVQFK